MTDNLIEVIVKSKTMETPDIAVFEVRRPDGTPLPPFDAGAHIDVHLTSGLVRQYSLCNPPSETLRYLIGVLATPDSRGGSRAMHERLSEGDTLKIGAPRNLFALDAGAPHSLLFAGGIGITPLLAMAEQLNQADRPFALHYFTRSRRQTAFISRLSGAAYAERVTHHFDDEPDSAQDIASLLHNAPAGAHLYVCGPKGFMDAVLSTARDAGWETDRLHFEFFGEQAASGADHGFDLLLARSGRVLRVAPDQTVLKALIAAGLSIPTACEQGICGTCLTRVLGGTPDHRDQYLTPEEQAAGDQFLPCCSRSLTARLEIDL